MAIPLSVQAQPSKGVFEVSKSNYYIDSFSFNMDVAPFIENGRVYVPIRYLAHILSIPGDGIVWDAPSQTVFLKKAGTETISLQVGRSIMERSYSPPVFMDVVPVIRFDRVFLPARYVAEAFAYQVQWIPQENVVQIYKGEESYAPSLSVPDPVSEARVEDETPIPPYIWEYNGATWRWSSDLPQSTADSILKQYQELPHLHKNRQDLVSTYCTDKENIQLIKNIAEAMRNGAAESGLSEEEIPYLAIAFVQSFPYVLDSVSSGYDEYPRYPVETLLERKGDCEDTAILTAVLLRQLGYGTALIIFDNHCAVGVKGKDTLEGYYFTENNTRYYYLETTSVGWQVGVMPDDYQDKKAVVLQLK